MPFNSTTIAYGVAAAALIILAIQMYRSSHNNKATARIAPFDRFVYFLQSRASKVVVVALVLNTMIAQLLYNSAGQLVLSKSVLLAYLIISAASSTLAFALFEVSTIFQLHDLMALDKSIKVEIDADKLINRGFIVLGISSLINFLSVFYFLALAWHTTGAKASPFPLDNLPEPFNYIYYAFHALAYTAVLFMAGLFGERPRSSKELVLAVERELEQEATEGWKLQMQAKIVQMKRDGVSLSATAVALASPETATRIVLLEQATSGTITALQAAQIHNQDDNETAGMLQRLTTLHQAPQPIDQRADTSSRGTLDYDASSPELRDYVLPNGISLTTFDSMTNVAKTLGTTRQTVAKAMKDADMSYLSATDGQVYNGQNVAVWQVLSLVESGLIDLPTKVSKRGESLTLVH